MTVMLLSPLLDLMTDTALKKEIYKKFLLVAVIQTKVAVSLNPL